MPKIAMIATKILEEKNIPFWKSLRDNLYGGYYGYMDIDLKLDKKADKGCILTSRILWFFSRCWKVLGREDCLDEARHCYAFLTSHCLDPVNGGVYWSVNYKGEPSDTTKHTYNQAFAIYGLSEYYDATGDESALKLARELFTLIESKCRDEGGYLEAFDQTFCPASNEKLSENGVMAQRTMNTLLHVFEGYSGLYQVSHDAEVGRAMKEILGIYMDKIYNPLLKRQEVFFDRDYRSLIDLHSYGHDIESSWLLDWGCGLLGDQELAGKISEINSELARNVYRRAFRNDSLLSECERGVDKTNRIWWVQCEAVLGFVHQWEKCPEETCFRNGAAELIRYILTVMIDPRPGSEWFSEVNENGVPDRNKPILEEWKCPYHNGRMCLELISKNPDIEV